MHGEGALTGIAGVVAAAGQAGVELWVEGRRLRFRSLSGELPAGLREQLRARRGELIGFLREEATQRTDRGPLGANQLGLWFLHRLVSQSPAYHVAFAARIHDSVDVEALGESLQVLVDRHDALRTTYLPGPGGEPVRRVVGARPVAFELRDVHGIDEPALEAALAAEYARPFDLAEGPLFKAVLYRESDDRAALLLVAHHLAVDGTSLFVLLDELFVTYEALTKAAPVLLRSPAAQYGDFVEWQQASVLADQAAASFWAERLRPPPPPLELPTDRPRPRIPRLRGASHQSPLDADLSARLSAFSRSHGVTDYVTLLALWYAFLARITGQDDITVGTPVHGRASVRFERTVGDLINMVPLRERTCSTGSFRELVARTRTTVLQSLAHQDYPLPLMVERMGQRQEHTGAPFRTLFVLQDFGSFGEVEEIFFAPPERRFRFGTLTLSRFPLRQQEGQFDISLEVGRHEGRFHAVWKFDTDLFDAATVERWAEDFAALVHDALARPDVPLPELRLVSQATRQALEAWNGTGREQPSAALPALFAAQAARTPNAPAVSAADGGYTYAELLARAQQVTGGLRALGVKPGERVAVLVRRGRDLPAALLGVLGAGAAYVPLDPKFPPARLAYMLEDSGAVALVCAGAELDAGALSVLELDRLAAEPERFADVSADAAAYVIYTSGSTGQPKGVAVPHGALTNFLASMAAEPGLMPGDTLLSVTTISFDIAGLELYLPLTIGARVYVADEETVLDGLRLARMMEQEHVTVLQATPATWKLLLATGWTGKPDLRALCGGEALPEGLAAELLPRVGQLWNLYGPTETTIWSTVDRVIAGEPVLVGRPIANTTVYVLDEAMQPVPIGVPGELWIGGAGVALGYHGRPDLTAQRFLDSPFRTGERIYRTGDLVRFRADGRLQHLGRLDHQVKVRGFRIELGEIEARLQAHPSVRDAVVVAREERLVAYVVPADDAPDSAALRSWLGEALPDYMVPGIFVTLDALPLTPNGKVDRKALPEAAAAAQPDLSRTPPTGPVEVALATIWTDLLGVEPAREDDFFALGGHSLIAARMVAHIQQRMDVTLPMAAIFQSPLLGDLAARVEALGPASAGTPGLETIEF